MRNCGAAIHNCLEGIQIFLTRICLKLFCCCCRNKVTSVAETRHIDVGAVDELDKKKHNKIKTSKYTLLMFLPKNLAEQFRRVVNFYFLIVTVIALLIDSPVSPMTSIAPLSFMVLVTAVKQGYEDWLRHKADNRVNNKMVETIYGDVVREVKNSTIAPGTLVRVKKGNEVPADLVLLCTEGVNGKCFVTTANLDGETNLKTLRVPQLLVGYTSDKLPPGMHIEVPNPVADLYTFYGRLDIPAHASLALNTDNLMLRGSRVKNTEWAIGCAVYTGEETKLALNSKYSGNKFSSCELAINGFQLFFIILLVLEIVGSMIAKIMIERRHPERDLYLGESSFSVKQCLQDFFSFLLLYYYIIPMSLYVTIELYKFVGALFFNWDEDLRCDETGRPAAANTSDLNEELGQVEVLFSDKTGTLTKNLMVFKACSIQGQLFEERDGKLFDDKFEDTVNAGQTDIRFFFTIIALCHTVQISNETKKRVSRHFSIAEDVKFIKLFNKTKKKNGITNNNNGVNGINRPETAITMDYQSSSPDEKALVEAADRAGITFFGDEGNNLLIKIGDEMEIYEKLQTIEFTSERKRMSIIVRDRHGKIWLFCKGADSAVLRLCKDSPLVAETNRDIHAFATRGLRTLAIAYRQLSDEEYYKVADSINTAETKSAEELQMLTRQYRVLEQQLTLVGATAVEDCLQDDVADTLASLRRAGVKTWVLTGDKVETAINVAQSCSHISENDRQMFIVEVNEEDALMNHLAECQRIISEPSYRDLTLIVDGTTMSNILDTKRADQFVSISMACKAVLCCRLSPIQKAKIVRLIKESPTRPITAAIGDGANDISMIQEAHVGFGIYGREGHQAARCADFAFTKFSMLKKILLVLGHWYYQRLTTLIHYFFYKNLVLGNIMLLFQVYSAFSTQSIYDSLYLTFFNLGFTSVPCLLLSVTEQRWPPKLLMQNPSYYRMITRNKLMRWRVFSAWIASATYHSLIIYFFTYLIVKSSVINTDGKTLDFWTFGAVLFHLSLLIVNLKLWLQTRYHTFYFVLSVVLSVLLYVAFNILYSAIYIRYDGDVLGTYIRLLWSFSFWMLNLLTVVASLAVDFVYRVVSDKAARGFSEMNAMSIFTTKL